MERKQSWCQTFYIYKIEIVSTCNELQVVGAYLANCYETGLWNLCILSVVPSMLDKNLKMLWKY
jgi:hypothetical protein